FSGIALVWLIFCISELPCIFKCRDYFIDISCGYVIQHHCSGGSITGYYTITTGSACLIAKEN
ncbi:hypothetical protein BR263_004188, partial [Escherichia coli]